MEIEYVKTKASVEASLTFQLNYDTIAQNELELLKLQMHVHTILFYSVCIEEVKSVI